MKRLAALAILLFAIGLPAHAQGPIKATVVTHAIVITVNQYVQGPDIATGFNFYRGTVSGGPYTKLNAMPIPIATPTYSDTAGTGGVTYYYVATAVDAAAVESMNSAQASGTFIATRPNTPNISISVTATAKGK